MKSISTIAFVCIYLIGMLRPVAPFIEYEINKGYISEFLCINKDKQEEITVCLGKCYLNKKLLEAQENDSKAPISTISLLEYPIGIIEILSIDFLNIKNIIRHTTEHNSLYKFQFSKGIYHPPTSS